MDNSNNQKIWYLAQDQKKYGPLSDTDMNLLFSKGRVSDKALIWKKGYKNWIPITESVFADEFDETPPLPPQAMARPTRNANVKIPPLVYGVIKGVRTTAILWTITAGFQLTVSAIGVLLCIFGDDSIFSYIWVTALGIWNLVNCIKEYHYCAYLKTNFTNITSRATINAGVIINYIYNTGVGLYLIFSSGGSMFGILLGGLTIAAIIVEGVGYRGYVKKNYAALRAIESLYSGQN